ncbi:hypothetical protein DVH24_034111 [Malus domestica]|uniref:Uncharacterized protein n=1 Tax=Malus domestica TaxID=3750 RepID=A0A498KSR6_MALDO|nr:hypothetical protein DVH24_034111 [Malus domestica]
MPGEASTHDQDVFSFYEDEQHSNGFEEAATKASRCELTNFGFVNHIHKQQQPWRRCKSSWSLRQNLLLRVLLRSLYNCLWSSAAFTVLVH